MASPGLDQGALLLKRQLMGKLSQIGPLCFHILKETQAGLVVHNVTKRYPIKLKGCSYIICIE